MQQLLGTSITCNLNEHPALGRGLVDGDCAAPGANAVVVVSDQLWRNSFGADLSLVGKTIMLNRTAYTVVGIAAAGFTGTEAIPSAFWAPITMEKALEPGRLRMADANQSWLALLGRTRPGVTVQEVRADLGVIAGRIDQQYPGRTTSLAIRTATFFNSPEERGLVISVASVTLGAFALVLLIACANVANLLATFRSLAIRMSDCWTRYANPFKGQDETMQSKAPTITSKFAGSQPTHTIAGLVIFLVWTCITPAIFGQQDVHAALIPPANRKSAPAFQLVTEDGTKMQISDYRGKVVLLNFWATDCGGCVLEIPSFIELENAYKGKGFTAVGVSMDISYESLKDANEAWGRVRPFIAKHGVNYPIAMGDDAISKAYSLNAFPATYLIDKSGRIAVAYVGVVINKDNVATNVKSLLSER